MLAADGHQPCLGEEERPEPVPVALDARVPRDDFVHRGDDGVDRLDIGGIGHWLRRHLGDLRGGRLGFGHRVVGAGFGRGAPERECEDGGEERLAQGVGG